MSIIHTGYCMSHRGKPCNCGAADTIYDESGTTIGEARPINEPSDIALDILDDEVLPTSGIKVVEHVTPAERNTFTFAYLNARENRNAYLRECG